MLSSPFHRHDKWLWSLHCDIRFPLGQDGMQRTASEGAISDPESEAPTTLQIFHPMGLDR